MAEDPRIRIVNPNTRNRSMRRAVWFIALLGMTLILGGIDEAKVPRNGLAKTLNPYNYNQFGELLEEDQVWRILAHIRSLYQVEPCTRVW